MPDMENQVNIGKLEVQVEDIKKNMGTLQSEVKTLSNNITLALTEMKVYQVEMKNTAEKARIANEKVDNLKKDEIKPMREKQEELALNIRAFRWIAGILFIGLTYAVFDKIITLF